MKSSTKHYLWGIGLVFAADLTNDLRTSLGLLILGAVSCGAAVILREMEK